MIRRITLLCLGLILTAPVLVAQKTTPLDSLRTLIIEHASDTVTTEVDPLWLSTAEYYLQKAKEARSDIDIMLAYQQLAAYNYRLGNTNKALRFYRLYVLEEQHYLEQIREKASMAQMLLYEKQLTALEEELQQLREENNKLKSTQEEFYLRNYWIFLGMKIMLAIAGILLLGWLYVRLKKTKKKTKKADSPAINSQLSSLLETTKQKLAVAETEQDLCDILVAETLVKPQSHFSENKTIHNKFLIYQPKKLAGGDGVYFAVSKQKTLIAIFDAPGYGATGGLLSTLVYKQLEDLFRNHHIEAPDMLLGQMELNLKNKFPAGPPFTGGINIGICLYDASRKIIQYAGANMELFIVQKGIRHSIHGAAQGLLCNEAGQNYELIEVEVLRNSNFYLCTDGFWAQQGGYDNKPLGKETFEKTIESLAGQPINEHKKVLEKIINDWRGGNAQNDDILVLGFGFK